ncbi:MAG TPA: MEDS domain-containing protein, partial [Verrucomicrobiae bacterium]|nr:MEDS domain-containing protein [Verrucomicrobiae bacterium]
MGADYKSKLQSLAQGHHACLFYKNIEVAIPITIEFIKIGLERNERCLYLADPLTLAALKRQLSHVLDVEREASRGALQLSSERHHLVDGRFDGANMIGLLEKGVKGALKAGFAGLRAAGDVIWELGSDIDMGKLAHYEAVLDKFFTGQKLTGLCQYNCNVFEHDCLCRSLTAHNA